MTQRKMETQRWFTMAEAYDQVCRHLVPHYDFLQERELEIADLPNDREVVIVDLGAGSGTFLERALGRYSRARGYWVDYSEEFERVARSKLAPFGDRVSYVISRFEGAWEAQIGEPADLIHSMSAIHHLDAAGKRDLYRRCLRALNPGGWFLNVDEMKTLTKEGYLNSMRRWVEHVAHGAEGLDAELLPYYEVVSVHFDNWERRNVLGIDEPKGPGDDLHESYVDQVGYLREAGFQDADLFVKLHLWSIIGGRKPNAGQVGGSR